MCAAVGLGPTGGAVQREPEQAEELAAVLNAAAASISIHPDPLLAGEPRSFEFTCLKVNKGHRLLP